MKTRVISTSIWDEDEVFTLNIDTKLLYLVLLTNPYVGQTRFYKISDRQLSTFTGLNIEQLQKCKKDLENSRMAFFKDSWVCITGYGFVECFYKGKRNEVAKVKEIKLIPSEVLGYFNEILDTLSIPYQYPTDTTINNKSKIINNKSKIVIEKQDESLSLLVGIYNGLFNKKVVSTKGFERNYQYWKDIHGLDKIQKALENASKDNFWRDKMTLTILFRKKNPNGEPVDYIEDLANRKMSYTGRIAII